jgi:polysaccharide export outer membrane protein
MLAVCAAGAGCQTFVPDARFCESPIPRELTKVSLPTYRVEPPDILLIDALRVIPLPPYRAQPLDALAIQVTGVLEQEPIYGLYPIAPDGTVTLGFTYGSVQVAGLTLDEVKEAVEKHLKQKKFKEPQAFVGLGQSRALQQIKGEHLVRPDGTLALGTYGNIPVAGLTLPEVKAAVEARLAQYLKDPEVSVDVLAYNSKVIYVVLDQGGTGQQVVKLPVKGNETVLDVMSDVGGLTAVSSKHRIWIARPGPACAPCDQILPVDWVAITTRARTETNYQLMPGDRVYVQAESLVTVNTALSKLFAPFQQLLGTALLGNGVVRVFSQSIHSNNGTGTGF